MDQESIVLAFYLLLFASLYVFLIQVRSNPDFTIIKIILAMYAMLLLGFILVRTQIAGFYQAMLAFDKIFGYVTIVETAVSLYY